VNKAEGRPATPPLSIHAWLRYSTIELLLSQIRPRSVLEIGVGLGSVGVLLARRYEYTGIDLDEPALATARDRFRRCGVDPARLVLGGLEQVEGRQFDLLCAFEVLEHLEDDVAALTEWHSHVASGGWVALSVPADPRRFSKADEKAGHYRRYTRESLSAALTRAGFSSISLRNYGFPVGYLLEAGRNLYARRHMGSETSHEERTLASGRWLQPPESAGRAMAIVSRPLCLFQRPFATRELGTGLVAFAQRPQPEQASPRV
jgi:SAM-dependent methyltransferase